MTDPYDVGTISVPAGGTTVTGTDTFWVGKVRKNDLLVVDGLVSRVTADPMANGTLAIKPWPGAALVNAAYEIIPTSAGVDVSARLRELLYGLSLVSAGWDAKVPNLAARAAFDDRPGPTATERGFAVMVDDIGTGQAAIYAKQSNANADWSPPALWTGPIGPDGPYTEISIGPVTTLPAGQPATADVIVIGPGAVRIDLGLPKGQDGTGTGDFVGPNGSVAGRLVSFADATGKLGADSGVPAGAILRVDGAQIYTPAEQEQARANIGAISNRPSSGLTFADQEQAIILQRGGKTLILGQATDGRAFLYDTALARDAFRYTADGDFSYWGPFRSVRRGAAVWGGVLGSGGYGDYIVPASCVMVGLTHEPTASAYQRGVIAIWYATIQQMGADGIWYNVAQA